MAKTNKVLIKLALLLILIACLGLAGFFSFTQELPITQTDGASYYVYAKTFSETLDLNADLPEYNYLDSLEKKVSDYPPFMIVTLGALLKVFGNDIFFMNGFYGALFFVMAALFFYLLCKKILNSDVFAVLATVFFILNVRAYIFLFSGVLTAFIAFCISVPAIYFTYAYFSDNKKKNLFFAIAFSFLVSLTYFQIFLFVFLLQICMSIGFYLEQRLKINFPKISAKLELTSSLNNFKKYFFILIPSLLFLILTLFLFVIKVGARSNFITEYISNLLQPSVSLFYAWRNPFIVDCPIITLFFIFGLIYLVYKNNWKLFFPFSFVLIWFMIPTVLFLEDTFLVTYIYRAYILTYALMVILFFYLLKRMYDSKVLRKIVIILIILSLLLQIAKIGVFFSIVGPAITLEQKNAAIYLSKISKNEPILFVNNMEELGLFKSFKWILVYAKPANFKIQEKLSEKPNTKYVFIADANANFESEFLEGYKKIYYKGSMIYKKHN